jgi:hypothetical protein
VCAYYFFLMWLFFKVLTVFFIYFGFFNVCIILI